MTTLYFVRHAQPNYDNHNDLTRELSPKGLADRLLINRLLENVHVYAVLSSPFRRAMDTVRPLADSRGLPIITVDDFRERRIADGWIEDFSGYARAQWEDFDYKRPGGESLREVQRRNLAALERVLQQYAGQTVVIGSHGTALSTIVHHFAPPFGYAGFESVRNLMPWVVRFTFHEGRCTEVRSINVFDPSATP